MTTISFLTHLLKSHGIRRLLRPGIGFTVILILHLNLVLGGVAHATVLYWFTGETMTVGTKFNMGQRVNADVGTAMAQVSDAVDVISGGPDNGTQSSIAQAYAIQIANVPDAVPGRPGTNAIRFEVRRGDYKYYGHRAEFLLPHVPTNGVYWYAWSIYVPTNEGGDELYNELLGQCHADDTSGTKYMPNPPWQINRAPYNGSKTGLLTNGTMDWQIMLVHGTTNWPYTYYHIGGPTTNTWVDWVVQVKWARDNTGLYNIWKNGELVVSSNNVTTDAVTAKFWPYFKFGIYKWPWKQSYYTGSFPSRVVYYDEVKVGDGSETYSSMAPRRGISGKK